MAIKEKMGRERPMNFEIEKQIWAFGLGMVIFVFLVIVYGWVVVFFPLFGVGWGGG